MGVTPETILAVVAVINAVGANLALLIHALRVPYRESPEKEAAKAAAIMPRQKQNHP